MKTAVIFYSWSGHTKRLAEEKARKENAAVFEIRDRNRPGTLKAYTAGCFAALREKRTPVEEFSIPFEEFDDLVIMAPVWAGRLAPAINNVFDVLPSGKSVTVYAVSGSGSSGCRDRVGDLVRGRGCKYIGFEDLKG